MQLTIMLTICLQKFQKNQLSNTCNSTANGSERLKALPQERSPGRWWHKGGRSSGYYLSLGCGETCCACGLCLGRKSIKRSQALRDFLMHQVSTLFTHDDCAWSAHHYFGSIVQLIRDIDTRAISLATKHSV